MFRRGFLDSRLEGSVPSVDHKAAVLCDYCGADGFRSAGTNRSPAAVPPLCLRQSPSFCLSAAFSPAMNISPGFVRLKTSNKRRQEGPVRRE